MKYLVIILIIIITSCSPIKRHNRLVDRHPYVHTQDTTVIHDTTEIIVPEIKEYKTVLINELTDTVVLEKDKLRVQVHTVHDSVYIEGECKTDTIIETKEILVPTMKSTPDPKTGWEKYFWWGILAFVLFIIYKIIRK